MPGTADRGDPLASLTAFERFAFRLTHRMNRGRWKALWSRCQRAIGARWIGLASSRLLRVHGLEHLDALPADRPLLLVANHRSFFDFYVIASVLLRRLRRPVRLYFPVRGRYFYQSPVGLLINFLIGWWSMFPPLFSSERRRRFDAHALGVLIELLRDPATVVGLHPEGRRNLGPDPYQFLPPQPGVGRLIHQARPAVVPVFVAGLGNDLVRQLAANWLGGEPIRVRFGPPLDHRRFHELPATGSTYRTIAGAVMEAIRELAEADRAAGGAPATPPAGAPRGTSG